MKWSTQHRARLLMIQIIMQCVGFLCSFSRIIYVSMYCYCVTSDNSNEKCKIERRIKNKFQINDKLAKWRFSSSRKWRFLHCRLYFMPVPESESRLCSRFSLFSHPNLTILRNSSTFIEITFFRFSDKIWHWKFFLQT